MAAKSWESIFQVFLSRGIRGRESGRERRYQCSLYTFFVTFATFSCLCYCSHINRVKHGTVPVSWCNSLNKIERVCPHTALGSVKSDLEAIQFHGGFASCSLIPLGLRHRTNQRVMAGVVWALAGASDHSTNQCPTIQPWDHCSFRPCWVRGLPTHC